SGPAEAVDNAGDLIQAARARRGRQGWPTRLFQSLLRLISSGESCRPQPVVSPARASSRAAPRGPRALKSPIAANAVFRLVQAKVPRCAGGVAEGGDFRFLSHRGTYGEHAALVGAKRAQQLIGAGQLQAAAIWIRVGITAARILTEQRN